MKKSEKIEVRLSLEEKEALSELAKQEGKSVSGLIRDLIEKYMSLNVARPIKTSTWGKLAAVAVVGALIGHLGTYAFVQSHNVAHAAERAAINTVQIDIDGYGLEVPLIVKHDTTHNFIIATNADVMKVDLNVTQENDRLMRLSVDICAQKETGCEYVANPSILIHPDKTVSSHNAGVNGEFIEIRTIPPFNRPAN